MSLFTTVYTMKARIMKKIWMLLGLLVIDYNYTQDQARADEQLYSLQSYASLQDLQVEIAEFVHERDWEKFNNLKNLAMAVSIESAELLEQFLWIAEGDLDLDSAKNRQNIEDEAADVLISLLQFCNAARIDLHQAFCHKLEKTKAKYPVNVIKGIHTKYQKPKRNQKS